MNVQRKEVFTTSIFAPPREVIAFLAFHVGAGEELDAKRAVRAALPDAITLAMSLEIHTW